MPHFSKLGFCKTALSVAALGLMTMPATADQVILDDLIVDGSACIGQDCVNGESFGFDTLRLKENNLRIKAQDTSNSASFPTTDWQITFNDSGNGGANKFSIDDIDANRTPFTIEANSANNSLYVDSGGNIGFGTASPVLELHVVDGDSPALRLEQDGSSGFTPQTFDIATNETNFFVRDVTNGSRLPFKIIPGADSNALYIASNSNIGMGTASPAAPLHVFDSANAVGPEDMLLLQNNGNPQIVLKNDNNNAEWEVGGGLNFVIEQRNSTNGVIFTLAPDGNLQIGGTLTENSNRHAKFGIEPVDSSEILDKVTALPVSAWTYKHDAEDGTRHIGPMAQDFYAAFGLGAGPTGISTMDTSGVALAAIQALAEENRQLMARIEALEFELN